MRPPSIVKFEQLYWVNIALGVIGLVVLLTLGSGIPLPPNVPAAMADTVRTTAIVTGVLFGIGIPLLLLYFIARRGSPVAKWIWVVLFALGIAGLVLNLGRGTFPQGPTGVLAIVQAVLQAVMAYLLFRPDATAWFADGRG